MEIKATLKEALSKTGNNYVYVSLMLTPNCEKKVFLEPSELELVKIAYGNSSNK